VRRETALLKLIGLAFLLNRLVLNEKNMNEMNCIYTLSFHLSLGLKTRVFQQIVAKSSYFPKSIPFRRGCLYDHLVPFKDLNNLPLPWKRDMLREDSSHSQPHSFPRYMNASPKVNRTGHDFCSL